MVQKFQSLEMVIGLNWNKKHDLETISKSCFYVLDWNRTSDLSLRRRSLYPTELREHASIIVAILTYFSKMTNLNLMKTF